MTIEEVIAKVGEAAGQKVTEFTPIKDLVSDSLEFLELMVQFEIHDLAVPHINIVWDLQRFAGSNKSSAITI
jgi:hypothetical protein